MPAEFEVRAGRTHTLTDPAPGSMKPHLGLLLIVSLGLRLHGILVVKSGFHTVFGLSRPLKSVVSEPQNCQAVGCLARTSHHLGETATDCFFVVNSAG
jgi:hypothetical protein